MKNAPMPARNVPTESALEFIPPPSPRERNRLCALLTVKMLREARRKGLHAELDISGDGMLTVYAWNNLDMWMMDICLRRLSYGKRWHSRDRGWTEDGAGRRCVSCGSETGNIQCDRCFPHKGI